MIGKQAAIAAFEDHRPAADPRQLLHHVAERLTGDGQVHQLPQDLLTPMLHRPPALTDQPRRVPLQRPDVRAFGQRQQRQTGGFRGFARRFANRAQHRRPRDAELGQAANGLVQMQPSSSSARIATGRSTSSPPARCPNAGGLDRIRAAQVTSRPSPAAPAATVVPGGNASVMTSSTVIIPGCASCRASCGSEWSSHSPYRSRSQGLT